MRPPPSFNIIKTRGRKYVAPARRERPVCRRNAAAAAAAAAAKSTQNAMQGRHGASAEAATEAASILTHIPRAGKPSPKRLAPKARRRPPRIRNMFQQPTKYGGRKTAPIFGPRPQPWCTLQKRIFVRSLTQVSTFGTPDRGCRGAVLGAEKRHPYLAPSPASGKRQAGARYLRSWTFWRQMPPVMVSMGHTAASCVAGLGVVWGLGVQHEAVLIQHSRGRGAVFVSEGRGGAWAGVSVCVCVVVAVMGWQKHTRATEKRTERYPPLPPIFEYGKRHPRFLSCPTARGDSPSDCTACW
jgi:hypothetical protein